MHRRKPRTHEALCPTTRRPHLSYPQVDIDDRILGDLISALGLATDEDSENALLARLKRFQLGWSVEHEFAALSLWFGRCTLIHFLDREKQLPESSLATYRVPDLLGVYSAGGREVPALIEVKSSYRLYLGHSIPETTWTPAATA